MTTSFVLAAADRPAGPAPLDQVLLATGFVVVMTLALGALLLAHRTGRTHVLDRLVARAEASRPLSGTAGWATIPLLCALVSLVTALLGMYWDIALHIGVGRDEGPLANPAHYPIMLGLFGVSASGALACALPRGGQAGPAAVRVTRDWSMPVGGLLLTGAGSYALLGFPLDDVWHRIFGQDVTLWGPTHLMLIGGAGLSLVGMALLFQEGRPAERRVSGVAVQRSVKRISLMGGLLIGLSVFQAEFDFGVPQFRLVLQPLLVATAAGLSLVAARMWIGRGGAVSAVVFYLVVRGGVSVVVGPVLGELWSSVPLYVGEALCVELAAVLLARRRPLVLAGVAGLLVGTVGFATEYAWTRLTFVLPWTPDLLPEGLLLAVVGGVAGGLLGGLLALGLQRRMPRPGASRALFALATVALAVATVDGLRTTIPDDLSATLDLSPAPAGAAPSTTAREHVLGEIRFDRPPVIGDPAWITVTAWQGSGSRGLFIDHLERVSPTTYRLTEPAPVGGSWKTMVRVHDGTDLAALPIYLPADAAIDEPEVPATAGATRSFGDEQELLQRELKPGVPGWLWAAAGLVVLACSLVLVLGLGWGVSRFARATREAEDASVRDHERELEPTG